MDSPRFMFPHRAFPGIVRHCDTSGEPCLLFTAIGSDAGLRHACNFYWNAKKAALTCSGSATSRNYLEETYPYPPHWVASDLTWAWAKSYLEYAADATAFSLMPAPTVNERQMHRPMTRISAISGRTYGSDPITLLPTWVSAIFVVESSESRTGNLSFTFRPTEIVWSIPHGRYAMLCELVAGFGGSDTSLGEGDEHSVSVYASLKSGAYVMDAGEVAGTLVLPDWLEAAGMFVVAASTVWNPNTEEYENLPCSMSMELGFEWWTYET